MAGVINPSSSNSSQSLSIYQANAAKVGSTVAPTTVQGGIVGPVVAAAAAPPSSSSASSSPSTTAKASGAGETRGHLALMGLVGAVAAAWGVSTLMM